MVPLEEIGGLLQFTNYNYYVQIETRISVE